MFRNSPARFVLAGAVLTIRHVSGQHVTNMFASAILSDRALERRCADLEPQCNLPANLVPLRHGYGARNRPLDLIPLRSDVAGSFIGSAATGL